jgi:hypothetical protein
MLLRVGPLHHHQHHAPRTAPAPGPVDEFVQPHPPSARGAARRPAQVRRGQSLQSGVALQACYVAQRRQRLQGREEALGREAGVDPQPHPLGAFGGVADAGQGEVQRAVGRVDVALAQPGGEEAALALPEQERMVAAHAVVPVVRTAGLVPMHLQGKRIQIQGDRRATSGRCQAARAPEQDALQSRPVLRGAEHRPQARQRRLRGEAAVVAHDARAATRRDAQAQKRIVPQEADVILIRVALGVQQQVRAKQVRQRVRDALRSAPVEEFLREKPRESGAVEEFPQEQGARVCTQALRARLDANAAVEIRLKQATLRFTHSVSSGGCGYGAASTPATYCSDKACAMGFLCLPLAVH